MISFRSRYHAITVPLPFLGKRNTPLLTITYRYRFKSKVMDGWERVRTVRDGQERYVKGLNGLVS